MESAVRDVERLASTESARLLRRLASRVAVKLGAGADAAAIIIITLSSRNEADMLPRRAMPSFSLTDAGSASGGTSSELLGTDPMTGARGADELELPAIERLVYDAL